MPIDNEIIMKLVQQNNELIKQNNEMNMKCDELINKMNEMNMNYDAIIFVLIRNTDCIMGNYDDDSDDDDEYNVYSKEKDDACKAFLKNIINDDGVLLGGVRNKWRKSKYEGGYALKVDIMELYTDYRAMCEKYDYKVYDYDSFLNTITKYDTGIKIKYDNLDNSIRVLAFIKALVLEYVK